MLSTVFLALATALPALAGELIEHTALGALYPYVVHLPDTPTPAANIPAHIGLHGMGSTSNEGENELQVKTLWNGVGRRLADWNEGNRTEANELAATRFLTILPLMPNNTAQREQDWNLERVYAVLTDVQQRYPTQYNHSNVVISGYSSGARSLWDIFVNPDAPRFRAAAISAGEPSVDRLPNLTNIDRNVYIQHYHGELDYEGASNLEACMRTQNALAPITPRVALVNVSGTGHNDMAENPFNVQMMRFLLGEDLSNFPNDTVAAITASSSSSSAAAPSISSSSSALPLPAAPAAAAASLAPSAAGVFASGNKNAATSTSSIPIFVTLAMTTLGLFLTVA